MRDSSHRRRPGWPVLLALMGMLAVAAYVVWRTDVTRTPVSGGATIGTVGTSAERSDADTWRHHPWSPDGGAPGVADRPARAPRPGGDPQRVAMERAFGVPDDGGALPFAPIVRAARLVSHDGPIVGPPDVACEVRVLPARSGRYDCLVRVMCGGAVLYPNRSQSGGYNTCELEDGAPVRVEDPGHTALDGDPRLTLDLRAGTAEVEDLGDGVVPYRASLRFEGL